MSCLRARARASAPVSPALVFSLALPSVASFRLAAAAAASGGPGRGRPPRRPRSLGRVAISRKKSWPAADAGEPRCAAFPRGSKRPFCRLQRRRRRLGWKINRAASARLARRRRPSGTPRVDIDCSSSSQRYTHTTRTQSAVRRSRTHMQSGEPATAALSALLLPLPLLKDKLWHKGKRDRSHDTSIQTTHST